MFAGKTVVVLGASGVVGTGIVRRFLDSGATVVAVSRSAANLDKLKERIAVAGHEPFHAVVGDFDTDDAARAAFDAISVKIGGAAIDHVITSQGFPNMTRAASITPVAELQTVLEAGLYNTLRAAQVFLPGLKAREGASFTLVSGGLAHVPPPMPGLWLGTVKNAAVNALSLALAAETAKDAVRVNTVCIHFGVAPPGESKNQFGMPAKDTMSLAPAFLSIARGMQKGKVLCLASLQDVEALAN